MKLGIKKILIRPDEQKGLASIVIVAVLVVLLSLISIGFARLMSRAVNDSLNNQLSSAAAYAAQSGVNDTIAFLQTHPNTPTVNQCNGLFGSPPTGITQSFANGNANYKYSCILVNTAPPSLGYTLPPSESQVAKVSPVDTSGNPTPASTLLFGWQATDNTKNDLACTGLLDESTWLSNGCPPLLRVTIYPVDGGGNVVQGGSNNQINSHTYFFYPNTSGFSAANQLSYIDPANPDGSIINVNCNSNSLGSFNGTVDKQCNVVINNLPADNELYVRLTSLYEQGDAEIQANGSGNKVLDFKGDQSLIDVTAQAGTASKRLQAKVAISNSTDITPVEAALPEDGLRSAEAICKHLDVNTSTGTVSVQGTGGFCQNQLNISQPLPPAINLCVVPSSSSCSGNSPQSATIDDGEDAVLTWNVTGSVSGGCSSSGFSGPAGAGNLGGTATVGPLSGGAAGGSGQDYTYTISGCSGPGGAGPAQTATVHVNAPSSGVPGCGSSCGPGGGGGPIAAFEFNPDPADVNDDDFILTTQNNPGYCVIVGNTDLGGGVSIWAPANGQYEYDYGPGSDTQATVTCYDYSGNDVGSAQADRTSPGGGGPGGSCQTNPETTPDGYTLQCVGDTHVWCDAYNELIEDYDQWGGLDQWVVGGC